MHQLCAYGLVLLTTLLSPASAQGPGDPCQALSGYMEAHPQCLVLGYCREVECLLSDTDFVAALSVRNCEDPVQLVLLVVYQDSGTYMTNTFHVVEGEGNCTVPVELDEPSLVYVSFSRNESHVHFRAETVYQGDNFLLVPAITIPLDPLNCMCEDIQDAVTNIQFPVPGIQHSCDIETADSCYKSHCDISYPGTTLHTVSVIDPCAESLEVTAFDDNSHQHQVFQETYTQSRSFPVSLGGFDATVSVNINHYNYSMSISVDVTINLLGSTVTLLPEQQIILDRSSCTPFQAYPAVPVSSDDRTDGCPLISTPPPPATPPMQKPCTALDGYVAANPGCSVRSHCHEVECTVLGISVVLSVESCQDPVQLTLRVPFSDSEKGDTQTFYVTQEEEQRCNWQGIMVIFSRNTTHLHFYAETLYQGDIILSLVPPISIPLDPLDCTCEDIQDATSNFQFPVPGMQFSCDTETDDSCYESQCDISIPDSPGTSVDLHTVSLIDPCAESLEVTIFNDTLHRDQIFHDIYTQSRSFHNTSVYINISHYNYSMSISVNVAVFNTTLTLLPEQQIILDRSSCTPFQAYPARGAYECPSGSNFSTPATLNFSTPATLNFSTPTTLSTPTRPVPTKGGSVVAVAVGVPVFFLVLVLAVAAIAVVVVLVYLKRRKNRSVRFRRMAFDQMDDDEET